MKLEYPLSYDALPSTENARDRLLAKIFQFRKNEVITGEEAAPVTKDEDYALLYAYALVTRQLSEEIKKLGRELEGLFGAIDEDLLKLQ